MKVITANRLLDGEVVWLDKNGDWAPDLAAALLLDDRQDIAAALALAARAVANREIVDPYEVDVMVEGGCLSPQRLRERIRAVGPTILPELGKQARAAKVS